MCFVMMYEIQGSQHIHDKYLGPGVQQVVWITCTDNGPSHGAGWHAWGCQVCHRLSKFVYYSSTIKKIHSDINYPYHFIAHHDGFLASNVAYGAAAIRSEEPLSGYYGHFVWVLDEPHCGEHFAWINAFGADSGALGVPQYAFMCHISGSLDCFRHIGKYSPLIEALQPLF